MWALLNFLQHSVYPMCNFEHDLKNKWFTCNLRITLHPFESSIQNDFRKNGFRQFLKILSFCLYAKSPKNPLLDTFWPKFGSKIGFRHFLITVILHHYGKKEKKTTTEKQKTVLCRSRGKLVTHEWANEQSLI